MGRTTLNEGRGVNPGDTRPARQAGPSLATLNEGRGVNPGDTRAPQWIAGPPEPLNEGRGVNPGDTRRRRRDPIGCRDRSTKAGA